MTNKTCSRCKFSSQEIIRTFCRKCYHHLKYKGEILNLEKPEIKSLSTTQHELLIGSLLGDAYLGRNTTSKYAHLKIERAIKDIEFLNYEYDILSSLCKSSVKSYTRKDGLRSCYFISRSYEVLDSLHKEWYKNGVKIVPQDIKLTPFIIAIWLCDDGNISLHHKKQKLLRTTFATNGFNLEEVKNLSYLLSERYKKNFIPSKSNIENQYVIIAADAATRTMWEDIKTIFPKSMNRKIKILEEE